MLTPREKFARALECEVRRRGKGFQARMADALAIPRPRFNDYLKNRINCPEDVRDRCASYLGMRYEDMLRMGEMLDGTIRPGGVVFPAVPVDILEAVQDKRIQAVIRCLVKEFKETGGMPGATL